MCIKRYTCIKKYMCIKIRGTENSINGLSSMEYSVWSSALSTTSYQKAKTVVFRANHGGLLHVSLSCYVL